MSSFQGSLKRFSELPGIFCAKPKIYVKDLPSLPQVHLFTKFSHILYTPKIAELQNDVCVYVWEFLRAGA